jgi:polyhydroxyalkanoate synthesis regulator phasin
MSKKLAGTGLAIGLIAGAGAGLILELSGSAGAAGTATTVVVDDSTADSTPDSTTDATTDTTAPADPVRPDSSTRLEEVLKPLVDDGTITQDQADKVIAALVEARPDGGPIGGHRGFGGRGGLGGPGGIIGAGLDVVATTLGITNDEVRTALESGQSIADLAVSKGKTAQDVVDAIVAEVTTRINTAVTDGKLTQAQADTRLADLTTRITELVNSTASFDGPGLGGHGFGGPGFGGPGRHHDDNDAAADAPADTSATTDTVAG